MDVILNYLFTFFGILFFVRIVKVTKFIWRPKIKLIGLHDIKNIKKFDGNIENENKTLFNAIKSEICEMKLIKGALKKKENG